MADELDKPKLTLIFWSKPFMYTIKQNTKNPPTIWPNPATQQKKFQQLQASRWDNLAPRVLGFRSIARSNPIADKNLEYKWRVEGQTYYPLSF